MTDSSLSRFALADAIKSELDPVIKKKYGFSILNCTPEQKEKVRPLLVSHGNKKREETEGRHWIDILDYKIKHFRGIHPEAIPCVCDIRYDFYESDEVNWVKEECDGILVHIQKYKYANGIRVLSPPANKHEAENEPKLIKKANYKVLWENVLGEGSNYNDSSENLQILSKKLNEHIEEFLKWLNR